MSKRCFTSPCIQLEEYFEAERVSTIILTDTQEVFMWLAGSKYHYHIDSEWPNRYKPFSQKYGYLACTIIYLGS